MGLYVAIPLVLFILLLLWVVPVGLWLQAIFSIGGGDVTILGLVGMRFRRVPPGVIVNGLIAARKAGLHDVSTSDLEVHYMAGGNVDKVVDALIAASKAGIELTYSIATAIDLAGIVKHVTILEFSSELNGDQILIDRLKSLDNIDIVVDAETQKINGKDKVNSLTYKDRKLNREEQLDVEAVFIQIGLISNSEWVKEDIKLSQYGEIVINDHGETSMPGVFAAGDVTTIPYKQIIIAMGEGSKAALGAFDYLIRH